MENSGCEACPAYAKCTANYRGSSCAAIRDSYGLGDPKTHYDEIRGMSVEELAEWLEEHCYQYGWLDWLKQEVEDGR